MKQYWDAYAKAFDAIYSHKKSRVGVCLDHVFRRDMFERFEFALAGAKPVKGRTFLDVGCGSGVYVKALAEGGAARVVGLDFSPKMLALAEHRLAAGGRTFNVAAGLASNVAAGFSLRDQPGNVAAGFSLRDQPGNVAAGFSLRDAASTPQEKTQAEACGYKEGPRVGLHDERNLKVAATENAPPDTAEGFSLRSAASEPQEERGARRLAVEFVCADFMEYAPAETFDVVLGIGFMDYVADPLPVLKKMRALAKDKVLLSFPRAGTWRASARNLRLKLRLRRDLRGCRVYFYSEARIARLMRDAGFKDYRRGRVGQLCCVEGLC